MRVLTWNLWWQFGEWRQRQSAIAAELSEVDPDIALLQEVWATDEADQAAELAGATGLEMVRTMGLEERPQGFGNAVLSRWPLEVVEQLPLPTPSGQRPHRTALACRIEAPTGPVLAVVTHLSWRYDESELRQHQLSEVVALVDRHRSPDPTAHPVILGGDFNAVPGSDEIRRLTGLSRPYLPGLVFTDAWAAVGDGDGFTWTRDNPNSAGALWPRRRLDYVFVSWPRPRPLGNPVSCRLIGVDPRGGVVASDHYGVVAELDDRPVTEEAR